MAPTELILEAGGGGRHYWRDLWKYRELFFFLAWRDVAIRYKQTSVGLLWTVLRPLLTTVVFTVTFHRIAGVGAPAGVPYALVVMAGMLPWALFSGAFAGGSSSLVGNANLISKVYFPRLILPVSAVVVGFVDFVVSLVLLGLLMAWYGAAPSARLLVLPVFVLVAVAAAAGPAIWIGALNVRYRDFTQIVPFLLLLGGYLSPVAYTTDHVFANPGLAPFWKFVYALNPMVGVIDGFRWAILGGEFRIEWPAFVLSLGMIAALLAGGVAYLRRTEKGFADVI